MKKNEFVHNHLKEYKFLYISGILLVFVISSYFLQFSFEGVGGQDVWGQFGDFMGGVLNPLLSFIVIWILVEDLRSARAESQSAISAQLRTAEAMREQVTILRPKPHLLCHLSFVTTRSFSYGSFSSPEGLVCVRFKNFGKVPLFNLTIDMQNQTNMSCQYNIKVLYPDQVLEYPMYNTTFELIKAGDPHILKDIRLKIVKGFYTEIDTPAENILESQKEKFEFFFNDGDVWGLSIN